MTFGEFVKSKRLDAGLSLRQFCNLAGVDPSNWSKIERVRLPATYDRDKLEAIAKLIKLKKGTEEWYEFFDLAALSQKKIPEDIYSDKETIDALPLFFRTLRGEKPKKKELDRIFEMLKRR